METSLRGRRARAPRTPVMRRALALLLPLAALAAVGLFALSATPARAQSDDDGGPDPPAVSTQFKPSGVRFVLKRTTTQLPGLDAAASLAAAARGDGGADALAGDTTPESSGARLSPADELRQERVAAALKGVLGAGESGGAGGSGNADSSSTSSAAKVAGEEGGVEPTLARLRAEVAAAAGVAPSAEALARAATRSSEAAAGPAAAAAAAAAAEGVKRSWRSLNAYEAGNAVNNPQKIGWIPPDAAMAVGNGFVVASVNNAIRVYDSATGAPLSPPVDLTLLYGLPPLTPNAPRPNGCGDRLVDPATIYDPELKRWIQTMARIGLDGNCAPTGRFFIEVAVSSTASPLGSWHVYSIDTKNDNQGNPLFSDFPRAQVDPNVLVISANSFLGRRGPFVASTLLVVDKFALAKGLDKVGLADFFVETVGAWDEDAEAFTLSPAYVPPRKKGAAARRPNQITGPVAGNLKNAAAADAGDDDDDGSGGGGGGNAAVAAATGQTTAAAKAGASPAGSKKASRDTQKRRSKHAHRKHHKKGGGGGGGGGLPAYTEPFYLLSHSLSDEQRLIRYVLNGTRAVKRATTQAGLDALQAALTLTASPVVLEAPSITYPNVLLAVQPRAGNFPYGQSLSYKNPGFLGGPDFRVYSSAFAAGRLFGVFSTYVYEQAAGGQQLPFYATCLAQIDAATGAVLRADLLGAPREDTTWPSVAVDIKGRGAVISMISSETRYASVGVFRIAEDGSVGPLEVAMEGLGLEDGATQYSGTPRAGDYGTAVIEAETGDLWAASEYISRMSCGLAEWKVDGTCGGTRAPRSNWDTGVFAMQLA